MSYVPMLESEIESISWCDAELRGFTWSDDGRDVVLWINAADGSTASRLRTITRRWAEALEVRLVFRENAGGFPLSFDGGFTRRADGTFSLAVDFAGAGELRLVCSEVDVT